MMTLEGSYWSEMVCVGNVIEGVLRRREAMVVPHVVAISSAFALASGYRQPEATGPCSIPQETRKRP